jgi:hypothetical protein
MLTYRWPFVGALWVVIGVVVAAVYDYFQSVDTVSEVMTAIVAVVLWPTLLFGYDIQITR